MEIRIKEDGKLMKLELREFVVGQGHGVDYSCDMNLIPDNDGGEAFDDDGYPVVTEKQFDRIKDWCEEYVGRYNNDHYDITTDEHVSEDASEIVLTIEEVESKADCYYVVWQRDVKTIFGAGLTEDGARYDAERNNNFDEDEDGSNGLDRIEVNECSQAVYKWVISGGCGQESGHAVQLVNGIVEFVDEDQ